MLSMFNKLANVITKHYKLVLVAWIVVLLVSVPAMMRVNEVINYESTGVTEGDYESIQASEIISSEFQGLGGQQHLDHRAAGGRRHRHQFPGLRARPAERTSYPPPR